MEMWRHISLAFVWLVREFLWHTDKRLTRSFTYKIAHQDNFNNLNYEQIKPQMNKKNNAAMKDLHIIQVVLIHNFTKQKLMLF